MTGTSLGFTTNTRNSSIKSMQGCYDMEQHNCFGGSKRRRQIPTLGRETDRIKEYFMEEVCSCQF